MTPKRTTRNGLDTHLMNQIAELEAAYLNLEDATSERTFANSMADIYANSHDIDKRAELSAQLATRENTLSAAAYELGRVRQIVREVLNLDTEIMAGTIEGARVRQRENYAANLIVLSESLKARRAGKVTR